MYFDLLEQFTVLLPHCLDATPNLQEFVLRCRSLPPIARYMASERFIDRPYNNVMALFK